MTTVLVVDDEPGMRETITEILEGAGYAVISASDGDSAMAAFRRQPVDVVVMDVRMPGRDGVSVLQEMNGPPPNVIMMTAYALEERLRAAMESRAYAMVHKPFQARYLINLVEAASGRTA
jgi:CheY-like chemotaxis protein